MHPIHPKRCYVAHPYKAQTRELVQLQIQAARLAGLAAARRGWYPVMPTVNTGDFDVLAPEIPEAFWLSGTLGLLCTCDALLLAGDWTRSEGCRNEYAEATARGIPIYTLETLPDLTGATSASSTRLQDVDPAMRGGHA